MNNKELIKELINNFNSFKNKAEEMIKKIIIDEIGFEYDCQDYFIINNLYLFIIKNNFNKQKAIDYAIKNNINIDVKENSRAHIHIHTSDPYICIILYFLLDDNDLIEKNKEIITK